MLSIIANRYRSDKGTKKILSSEGDRHFYTPIYHDFFQTIRKDNLTILEIGIGSGASVKIWRDYFPNAEIHFIDIDDFSKFNTSRIFCHSGDQANREDLERIAQLVNKQFDIIIDDGGHYMAQQQISLGILFKYLKSGGRYFIEDLHTSYWPYNGYWAVYNNVPIDTNEDKTNSTLKLLKDLCSNKDRVQSQFLTEQENSYLNAHVGECHIFDVGINKYGPNHLAVLSKKNG